MNLRFRGRLARALATLAAPFATLFVPLPAPAAPPSATPAASAAPRVADCPPVAQAPTSEQVQAAVQAARDRGFLWRISKDGRNSYLYGTIHVGKLDWAFPGPQVREALMGAQALALELDLTDPKTLDELSRSTAGDARFQLPPAMQQRLARQAEAACLGLELLSGQHPVMQAITLTVLSARREGFDPAYAQELVLGGFARAAAKPIVALESAVQQAALLVPGDAKQAVAMAEQALSQLERGASRTALVRVARAWEQGDLDVLSRYEQWCECIETDDDRAFLRRVNDERNGPMAERIDALHSGGKTVFAAVGSLHMTGPLGLPHLMEKRGYSVQRVSFAPAAKQD
ncbi:TraB/GumN family protein [Aquincola sp. S2]|uniref:TraB/GumN family protein n=1 Tax=Pseudaquabacterium terrae TaxID=2732868 RepID=A0ABX2EM85_9BURK|nr:TraB/GumN family protein [Aquabacterium terrae]NRF69624.1 TraB/GumN family protein [Aquabacterium terrae]